MNDAGIFAFYATHPEVSDKQAFNGKCNQKEQGTAIIGCYVDNRIYVYDVTDKRLSGIREVTAAHEMLHAVYQRLSDNDRVAINKLIELEYAKLQDDPALAERMAFYARTEPGERDNELHSIIGTEIGAISPELETHYAKYFTKRSDLTTLYASYNQNFKDLENQRKTLDADLNTLKKKIEVDKELYTQHLDLLYKDIATYKQASSESKSQAALDAQYNALQVRIDAVKAEADGINDEINQLRRLIDQYNSTITQSQDLYKSIDSTLTPAPEV